MVLSVLILVQHLKGLVAESLKDDQVEAAVYPKYETKGDLAQCTANFTEWWVRDISGMEAVSNTETG